MVAGLKATVVHLRAAPAAISLKKKSVCVPLSLLLCLDYAGVEQLNEAYIRQLERDGKLESVYGKDATIIVPEKVWKR